MIDFKPLVTFWLCVLLSEAMQLGTWKKGNPEKPWGQWFHWGVPHFLSNLGVVLITYLFWDAQILDDVIAWALSWVGLEASMQWDKLLPYNVVTGAVLGIGADMFGDKLGRLTHLFWPSISGKLGVIAEVFKPKPSDKENP